MFEFWKERGKNPAKDLEQQLAKIGISYEELSKVEEDTPISNTMELFLLLMEAIPVMENLRVTCHKCKGKGKVFSDGPELKDYCDVCSATGVIPDPNGEKWVQRCLRILDY